MDKPVTWAEIAEKKFYLFTTQCYGGRLTDGRPTQHDSVITAGLDARWRCGHAVFTAALQTRHVKGYNSEVRPTQCIFPAARSAILLDIASDQAVQALVVLCNRGNM